MMLRLPCFFLVSLIATTRVVAANSNNKNDDDNTLNLLMLGNSFSEAHHLEETLSAMISERKGELAGGSVPSSVYADRFEHSSANLTDYLGAEVSKAISSERQWTWVTLQEQSEIPGFYPPDDNDAREDLWDRSMETVLQLNKEIQAAGATSVLMQTWGYFDKDPLNPDIYKNYLEMQDHITKGYEYYYREIMKKKSDDRSSTKVKIAPCGEAFRQVYQDDIERGNDPLASGSRFDSLYEQNESPRKHPSSEGAYLCACVLFETLTGLDVRGSTLPPSSSMFNDGSTPSVSKTRWIQDAAHAAIQEYGDKPPITKAAYQSSSEQHSSTLRGIFNFLFAFLLGGGMIVGWIGWKWYGAAGSVREQMESSTFYKLLPDGPGDNNMLMELIDQTSREPEWINPV